MPEEGQQQATIQLVYALLNDVKTQVERIDSRFTDEMGEMRRDLIGLQRDQLRTEASVVAQAVAQDTLQKAQSQFVTHDQIARDYVPRAEHERNRRESRETKRYWPQVLIGAASALPGTIGLFVLLANHVK